MTTPIHGRYWTAAEDALLRREYTNRDGYSRRVAVAIGVSPAAVMAYARRIGLAAPRKTPNHTWTPEEDAILRRDYRNTKASQRELARRLGLTQAQVSGRVQWLGLCRPKSPRWTAQEDDLLRGLYERYSAISVARRLHRSVSAVRGRAAALGLTGYRGREGWYGLAEVARILGQDHKWVRSRIECGALPARRRNGRNRDNTHWEIRDRDLRNFIRRHAWELHGRTVDLVTVVDLLAGILPAANHGDGAEPELEAAA